MPLSDTEKELSRQASFGDDVMKQRAAAIQLEDIRYGDEEPIAEPASAPAELAWKDVSTPDTPEERPTLEWKDANIPEEAWKDYGDTTPTVENTVDPDVRDMLPKDMKVGFGNYTVSLPIDLSDDADAFWVTFGEAMSWTYRGAKQMLGLDIEDMKQASKAVDKLYADEELRGNAFAGSIIGTLAEPVGFMIPGGKAASGGKALAKGFGIGATFGAAGYVEEDQTRLGNTLLGGTVGAVLNRTMHGASNYFSNSAVKKSRKDIETMERYWAEEMLKAPDEAAKLNAAKPMPSLYPSQDVYARRALNRMPENFSIVEALKNGRKLNPPRNLEEARFVVDSYGLTKEAPSMLKFLDKIVGVTSTRIGNIDEGVKGMVRQFDYVTKQEAHNYFIKVTPFLTRYRQAFKGDKKIATDRALLEGKFDVVERELQKIGPDAVNEFKQFQNVMRELGGRSEKAGLIKTIVQNYVPRYIKDIDGYMAEIGQEGKVYQGAIDAAFKRAEKKLPPGQKLSAEAKSEIIHRTVFGSRNTKAPRSSFTYERRLQEIPDYLMKYYSTPEEAVHSYIRNTVSDLYKRDFFGKNLKTLKLDDDFKLMDIDGSAKDFVTKRLSHLSSNQQTELIGLLSSRFGLGEKAPMGWIQDTKNIMYAALLGNPISAATQLGDVGVSIYINGFRNTLSAIVKSVRIPGTDKTLAKGISVKDWGLLDQLAEEFATTRRTGRWLHRAFQYSGFQYVDRLGKDVFINAAYSRLKQMPRTTFMRKYARELGADADKTFEDLAAGDMTPRVKALLFSKLADVQPISPTEVPQAYLNNPDMRMLYMFKTFMLKQVDVIRQTGYKEIQRGNVGLGMKNLMSYGIIMGSSGLASQDVKNLMLGKDIEHDDLPLDIGLNLLKTFGWSEYAKEQANQGNYSKIVTDFAVPPFNVFDKIVKQDPRAVPGIGQLYYYWAGGGIEKWHADQRKKRMDKATEPLRELRKDIKERTQR